MNDFQTINDIVNESVRNSSYITVLLSSAVFILYTLIIKLVDYFKSKGKNKPLLEMANAVKEISNNVVKLNAVLDKTFIKIEAKETTKTRSIIKVGFDSLRAEVMRFCEEVITFNNVNNNKEEITNNVYKCVTSAYYKLYSVYSAYEIDDIVLATKLKKEWIEEITTECLGVIFSEGDKVIRIRQLSTKLNLRFEEYCTYIENKMFND